MSSFIKSRMLWQYCASIITIPVKGVVAKEDTAFISHMVEWDSQNHTILTYLASENFHFLHLQSVG